MNLFIVTEVTELSMTHVKADASHFERGQVISAPSSLPGCVQLARLRNTRSNTKRLVVIKRYSLTELTREDEEVTEHIQHEVAAMKQFEHPNILPCLTSLVSGQEVWLVSPLAEFGSVKKLLSQEAFSQGLPELLICLVLRDLCHGLEYLHHQGVVHRAVRASHILLTESSAILTGLRHSTGLQATGEGKPNLYSYPMHGVTANLAWLAPEILQQNLLGYNESSDIYSLAVTVCEMANGVVPFSEMEPTLMMVEKLQGAAPSIIQAEAVSSHLHQLVAVCCSLEQQLRPTARDLLGHPCIKQLKKTNTTLGTLLSEVSKLQFSPSDKPDNKDKSSTSKPQISWIF